MKLVALEVTNYRSITNKSRLLLDDLTILIGPNNEGKSNLLRALVTAARILAGGQYYRHGRAGGVRYRYREPGSYDWERDYPVSLQQDNPEGTSDFLLSFQLNNSELDEFRTLTGIGLAGPLTLKLRLGREGANVDVSMRGPAKKRLNQKRAEIADFLRQHFEHQYIPSVRISELSEELVESLLARELARLEEEPPYAKLIDQLRALQRPVLDRLGRSLLETVAAFIPEVTEIRVENQQGLVHAVRRSARLLVNDGNPTELGLKGDGVQSLVAVALMRHISQSTAGSKNLLLAIEEPEAHLHPDAIHRLRNVIVETAKVFRVILTTHSPLLVDRSRPTRNIIVRSASAKAARSLAEIRECLGVRIADNLVSAFLILVIEGESDERILRAWLPVLDPEFSSHIRNGSLGFDTLRGSHNLSYIASMYKRNLCNCHAYLDNDESGRAAVQRALEERLLEPHEVHLATCPGMATSELEDLVNLDSYGKEIEDTFAISLSCAEFRNNKAKWSDRLEATFKAQSKAWNRQSEARCKGIVYKAVEENPTETLHPQRAGPIQAFAAALRQRLREGLA